MYNAGKTAHYRARAFAVSNARNVVKRSVVIYIAPFFYRRRTYPENSADIKRGKTGLHAYRHGRLYAVENNVFTRHTGNSAYVYRVAVIYRFAALHGVYTYKPLQL